MERLACVNLPAFPLQLLLRRRPDWAARPAVVVAEDKPQGSVLWVNDRARQVGVLPGLRYAAALSLAAGLRAGEVSPVEIGAAVEALNRRLIRYTPEVEPCSDEPGIFWLDGKGLKRLYRTPRNWAEAFKAAIEGEGFQSNVAVGFTRFGTYAVAKTVKGIKIFRDAVEERRAAEKISLDRLDLDTDFRATLIKLGIQTVGDMLSLPPGGLRERFGLEAHLLYRMAAGELWSPLEPHVPEEPVKQKCILDDPENDTTRLLFLLKQLLHPLITTLAGRSRALAALRLALLLDKNGWLKERIRPAAPTLDVSQIVDLIRLRLESLKFVSGVIEIELTAEACAATREQLRLFAEKPTRDLEAADRALARLRAEFGEQAVVQAKLTEGHLPEARFAWEPIDRVKLPRLDHDPAAVAPNSLKSLNSPSLRVLVRRIAAKPIPLASAPRHTHEDGWLLLGHKYGSVDKLTGPYVFSGGWWHREIQRDYYFAETRRGDLLWLYYDRVRRRWFLQGTVE